MENKINMKWGSPAFLKPYWAKNKLEIYQHVNNLNYQIGTDDKVKNSILDLHKLINNADINNKYVVVGNGATQLLRGLIKILGGPVYANPPHFSRFPIFVKNLGYSWDKVIYNLLIKTLPNNPDNSIDKNLSDKKVVHDLCYNWPQYTEVSPYNEEIMVFSLAKASGHASTRIGWCLLKDKNLAKKLENFIELDTAGVSIESQNLLISVIEDQKKDKEKVWEFGKKTLSSRWNEIKKLDLPFEVVNDSGMFLWAKGECPSFIEGISGEHFGVTKQFFRLNIGCEEENFYEFTKRFRKKN